MLGAGTGALVIGFTRDERLRRVQEAAVWGAVPLAVRREGCSVPRVYQFKAAHVWARRSQWQQLLPTNDLNTGSCRAKF